MKTVLEGYRSEGARLRVPGFSRFRLLERSVGEEMIESRYLNKNNIRVILWRTSFFTTIHFNQKTLPILLLPFPFLKNSNKQNPPLSPTYLSCTPKTSSKPLIPESASIISFTSASSSTQGFSVNSRTSS